MDTETPVICQWFLLCDRPATGVQEHPVLPPVPICDRCRALYERDR